MIFPLIIFLAGFFIQDTSVVIQLKDTSRHNVNAVSPADSIVPKKRKKKKIDSTEIRTVILKIDTLFPTDSCIHFFEKEKKLYFGNINDTTKIISSFEALLDSSREISFDIRQKRKTDMPYWIFYVMMLPLLSFVYVRLNFYNYLQDLIRSFFNITIAQQFYREQEPALTLSALLLNLNFVLAFAMYLYLLAGFYQLNFSVGGIELWLILCLLVTIVYTLKYFFLSVITFFFPIANEVNFYKFNVFLFNKITGIVLIFIVFVIAFAKIFLIKIMIVFSLILISGIFLYRFFRGLSIARDYLLFNKVHFFLYLCTFEIAPVVILIKLMMNWIKA